MLDMFLKVAYAQSEKEREQKEFTALLRQLPLEDLHKIAQTGLIPLTKQASAEMEWLEQFQGTPFMDQAISLEQERLQVEAAQQQQARQSDQQRMQANAACDQIRLRKRLLELQKAKADAAPLGMAAAASPEVPVAVAAPVKEAHWSPAVDQAGRLLARLDMAKRASVWDAVKTVAKNNPGMVVGGALGAAHGLLREDGGLGAAAVEGLGGAAAGHAIGGAMKHTGTSKTTEEAFNKYKKQLSDEWGAIRNARGAASGAAHGAASSAPKPPELEHPIQLWRPGN